MDMNRANVSSDYEFLSLKERILLMQNNEEAIVKKQSTSSVIKRVHTISDSEESDSNKRDTDDEFELPPLPNFSYISKDPEEVFVVSDNDDEVKALGPILVNSKEIIEFESNHVCSLHYSDKKSSSNESIDEIPKVSKKSKKPNVKSTKDADKEILKQQKLKLREEKKKEQEFAKAIRQSEKELQKSKKPDECLKAMRILVDHNFILQNESQDIFCALDEGNVKYSIEENPINLSIAWCKTVINIVVENNKVLKEEKEEFENNLVVLIPNESFIKMVFAFMQKSKGKDTNDTILSDYIVNISLLYPQMNVTCVLVGLDKYLRTVKENEMHDYELKRIAKQVSKVVIEEALVEVQLQANVNFIFATTMREFGDLLFRFTKAIAEAPQKKEKQMQKDLAFSWYADGDSSCPVKIGKDRSSYMKLWQQQLQQFQNVGQETAEAIAAVYSSPQSLMKAYSQCASVKDAERLLQDIVVRRNYGPLGTQRRVGPELSYKIYIFFTSQDGYQILQR